MNYPPKHPLLGFPRPRTSKSTGSSDKTSPQKNHATFTNANKENTSHSPAKPYTQSTTWTPIWPSTWTFIKPTSRSKQLARSKHSI